MRTPVLVILAFATPIALAGTPDGMPKRDPGLWEMQTTMVEMGGLGMRLRTCVDDTVDNLVPDDGSSDCDKPNYRIEDNRVTFEATCRADGSTATMTGIFVGDFTRSYRGEIRTVYTPPLQGMESSTMGIDAQWVGPCEAGQNAGDVEMMGITGLDRIDLDAMMKNMPR